MPRTLLLFVLDSPSLSVGGCIRQTISDFLGFVLLCVEVVAALMCAGWAIYATSSISSLRRERRRRLLAETPVVVSASVIQLRDQVKACEETAKAQLQVGEDLYSTSRVRTTDHERARYQVMSTLRGLIQRVDIGRRLSSNADLIRLHARVVRHINCCEACPSKNRDGQKRGESFTCLLQRQAQRNGFRFQLNKRGQIIEETQS